MTEFLIIVSIGLLLYIIIDGKKENREVKKEISYKKMLPHFMNKNCEIIVQKPMAGIDAMYSIRGLLIDADDEWLMLEKAEKKKKVTRVFRIELISGIKEIRE